MKELVNKGANCSCSDGFGALAIQHLARQATKDSIEFLLEHGAERDCMGAHGYESMLGELGIPGVPMTKLLDDAVYTGDDTVLHNAAFFGNLEGVKFLLERGADPRKKNKKGLSAADAARSGGFVDLANFLEEAESQCSSANQIKHSRSMGVTASQSFAGVPFAPVTPRSTRSNKSIKIRLPSQ